MIRRALAVLFLAAATPVMAVPIDLPDIPECTELVPGAIAFESTPVTLGLRLVLDGVGYAEAGNAIEAARQSYAPLGISLDVSVDLAQFASTTGLGLIDEVKQFYGGQRPAGTHLVFVLTSKNLTDELLGDALAGQADCIGGVAYPGNAFAVGEYDTEVGGKTLAHEVGHLLGGQHQFANCVEAALLGGDNLCTLMFNDVGLASLPFSTLNGLVVRGHAQLAGPAPATAATNSSGNAGGGSGGSSGGLTLLLLAAASALRRHPQAR